MKNYVKRILIFGSFILEKLEKREYFLLRNMCSIELYTSFNTY